MAPFPENCLDVASEKGENGGEGEPGNLLVKHLYLPSEEKSMAQAPRKWDVVAKVLSVLAACQVDKILCISNSSPTNTYGRSNLSQRMGAREITSKRKAGILVETVLATVSSGPTDAGWNNLAVIVDDILEGRQNALDLHTWIELAEVFMNVVASASSWAKELLPLNRLQLAMAVLYCSLQALNSTEDQEDLRAAIALSICKAGLFLAVINQSDRLSAVISVESNRRAAEKYVKDILQYLGILYEAGLLGGLETLWQEINNYPFSVPYSKNALFQGRKDSLEHMRTALNSTPGETGECSSNDKQPAMVCIVAPNGFGKSHLAVEYVYRHLAEYEGVFWVNASPLTATDSFLGLAPFLQVQLKQREAIEEKVCRVREVLEDGRKFLLVFDAVKNYSSLTNMLPKTGKAHIILTSEVASANRSMFNIALSGLTSAEALELVKAEGKDQESDDESLMHCLQLLRNVPMAVTIAARLLGRGMLLKELLQLLNSKKGPLPVLDTFLKPSCMRALIEESFRRLESSTGALAVAMVDVGAWFAAEAVPKEVLFLAARQLRASASSTDRLLQRDHTDAAIKLLLEFQFVQFNNMKDGFVFHHLVRDYAQTRKDSMQARKVVLYTLAGALCSEATMPHFASIWQQRKEVIRKNEDAAKVAGIGMKLGQYLNWRGRAAEAMAVCDELLDRRLFSVTAESRMKIRLLKAKVMLELMGDAGGNEELQKCCKENKGLLRTPSGLAIQAELAWSQARSLVLANPTKQNRKSMVATLVSNVALLRTLAVKLSEKVVERDEGGPYGGLLELCDDDVMVADAFLRLAGTLKELKSISTGEYLELLNNALRICEHALSPTHHRITEVLEMLGQAYAELRECVDQQELLHDAFRLVSWGGLEGAENLPEWGTGAPALVDLHFTHEQRRKACFVYEKQLAQAELIGRVDPLEEANIIANLGLMMRGPLTHDILEKAKFSLEGALMDISRQGTVMGREEHNEYVRSSQARLGLVHFRLGDDDGWIEAKKWLKKSLGEVGLKVKSAPVSPSLPEKGAVQGGQAVRLRSRLMCLGRVLIQQGALAEGLEYLWTALQLMGSADSMARFEEGQIFSLLATAEWLGGGQFNVVVEYLKNAKNLIEEEAGTVNLESADLLDCIARLKESTPAESTTSMQEAYRAYAASFDIRKAIVGTNHPALAVTLADMGRVEDLRGKKEAAASLRRKALTLLEKCEEWDMAQLREDLQSLCSEKGGTN